MTGQTKAEVVVRVHGSPPMIMTKQEVNEAWKAKVAEFDILREITPKTVQEAVDRQAAVVRVLAELHEVASTTPSDLYNIIDEEPKVELVSLVPDYVKEACDKVRVSGREKSRRYIFKDKVFEPKYAPHFDKYKGHTFQIYEKSFQDDTHVRIVCISDPAIKVDGYVERDLLKQKK